PRSRAGPGSGRFAGDALPESLEFFFNFWLLLIPGGLFGEGHVTLGQLLKVMITLDGRDDGLDFLLGHTLAVIFAILAALQNEVRPLREVPAAASDLISLFTDVAANHKVDATHLVEDFGPLLLDRR